MKLREDWQLRRIKIALGSWIVFLGVCGCGALKPMPEEVPNTIQSPKKPSPLSLKLKVMDENWNVLPEWSETISRYDENLVYAGDQITITRPIPNRGMGLYFAWPVESFGSKILLGYVTYHILNSSNQLLSEVATLPMELIPSQNFYFVSIFRLLEKRPTSLSKDFSAEIQIFTLEMTLATQVKKRIEIRFRVQSS